MSVTLETILAEFAAGRIPQSSISADLPCGEQLQQLAAYLASIRQFSLALANGDLAAPLPAVGGPVAGSLKSLHASLKHLTWQAQQITAGDFSQRVDFLGEFSHAFNTMVERLEESRASLEAMNQQLQDDNIQLRDLSEALRESEGRFRHIAENVSDVIWTLDSSMERFTYISPSIANLRGLSVAEAMEETLEQAMTPESLVKIRRLLTNKRAASGSGKDCFFSEVLEVEQLCRTGRHINVEIVVSIITDSEGQLKEFIGISRDISARKMAEDRLKFQSTHDAPTGLYNRAFFDAELELTTQENRFPVSLIVADLDGLKKINDTLGHEAGDQLIKGAAEILKMAFRGDDTVARTGGDEFVALLPEMDQDGARAAVERIRNCMQAFNSEHAGPLVSISLGTATAANADEIPLALKEADERMYADKVQRKQQRLD